MVGQRTENKKVEAPRDLESRLCGTAAEAQTQENWKQGDIDNREKEAMGIWRAVRAEGR